MSSRSRHERERSYRDRCRRGRGDGYFGTAEIAYREPTFDARIHHANAIARGVTRGGSPCHDRDLGAVADAADRRMSGVVGQGRMQRPVAPSSDVGSLADGEDGDADSRSRRAKRAPIEHDAPLEERPENLPTAQEAFGRDAARAERRDQAPTEITQDDPFTVGSRMLTVKLRTPSGVVVCDHEKVGAMLRRGDDRRALQ